MIVYKERKSVFVDDVRTNQIVDRILAGFSTRLGYRTSPSETGSWRNSLNFMKNVLEDDAIPADATVALEYRIPRTSKRIDCIVAGKSADLRNQMLIVELKQWSKIERTPMDGIVETFVGGGLREVEHPSYQAWTYAELIRHYNAAVADLDLAIHPCAYLHNCSDGSGVGNAFYQPYIDRAPLFLSPDFGRLADYVKERVQLPDSDDIVESLARGKVRPSPALADALEGMMKGSSDFLMIDDQKVVFESALRIAKTSSPERKSVFVVTGGPGSGKSVVAVNLLSTMLLERMNAQYVSKNAAPRTVFQLQLAGTYKRATISGLFTGSGQFVSQDSNAFDALIVDEAHRLNEKSGLYSNLGENQIKEIIAAASCSIFFLDEDQTVTLKDIGCK